MKTSTTGEMKFRLYHKSDIRRQIVFEILDGE